MPPSALSAADPASYSGLHAGITLAAICTIWPTSASLKQTVQR